MSVSDRMSGDDGDAEHFGDACLGQPDALSQLFNDQADGPGGNEADEWLGFAARVSARSATPDDLRRLGFAFAQWLDPASEEPLEELLGIPKTRDKRLQLLRNKWLIRAVPLLRERGPWKAALELEALWSRFVSRGDWRRWRDLRGPPNHADELGRSLYWATRYNDGDCLTARQIDRVIRHVIRRN